MRWFVSVMVRKRESRRALSILMEALLARVQLRE